MKLIVNWLIKLGILKKDLKIATKGAKGNLEN